MTNPLKQGRFCKRQHCMNRVTKIGMAYCSAKCSPYAYLNPSGYQAETAAKMKKMELERLARLERLKKEMLDRERIRCKTCGQVLTGRVGE